MLTIKIKDKEFILKQNPSDFLISEYESVSTLLNNSELDEFDKYYQLFILLGVDEDILDNLDTIEFFDIIKTYLNNNLSTGPLTKELVVNGRTYQSFDEKFYINVRDMKAIERFIKNNPDVFIGELMAILFKDVELSKTEHYIDAHIKHKAKLFRENITLDIAIPFIGYFSKDLISSLEIFKEIELSNED